PPARMMPLRFMRQVFEVMCRDRWKRLVSTRARCSQIAFRFGGADFSGQPQPLSGDVADGSLRTAFQQFRRLSLRVFGGSYRRGLNGAGSEPHSLSTARDAG